MGLFKKKEPLRFDDDIVQEQIQKVLGKMDFVYHSPVMFEFGSDVGGRSDVYIYDKHVDGFAYVTGDLLGKKQKKGNAGNYELMICHRKKEEVWGVHLISALAYYTLEASVNYGETMGLDDGPYASNDYTVKHLLFDKYAEVEFEKKRLGLMLVIGITQTEWDWIDENGSEKLIAILKEKDIYPFTDLYRESVV